MVIRGVIQRYWSTIALLAAIACLGSPDTAAQQVRPLEVWVDTLQFNVCDGQKGFIMAVHTSPILVSDSLVSAEVILSWDIRKLDLESDAIFSSETLGKQFDERKVEKLPNGVLHIQMGNTSLRPVFGSKPLFYVKGIVTAPDTVTGLDGWITVTSVRFFGNTEFNLVENRVGFVRVNRDTTPAYTGTLRVAPSSFDTVRFDTVALTIQNLKGRRVNEVSFALKADASNYEFIDTLQRGTLADGGWVTKSVTISPDSIGGRFVASNDLTADGDLIRIILRRKNDSAFSSALEVDRFTVNRESCLGKLIIEDGQISAVAVPSVDTSTVSVQEERQGEKSSGITVIPERDRRSLRVMGEGIQGKAIEIFDVVGTKLSLQSVEPRGASMVEIRLATQPPSGTYFMVLRGRNEIVYKQFTFIK